LKFFIKKLKIHVFGIDTDPDRPDPDLDTNPAKWCGSDQRSKSGSTTPVIWPALLESRAVPYGTLESHGGRDLVFSPLVVSPPSPIISTAVST
jgi:hypothetical protein